MEAASRAGEKGWIFISRESKPKASKTTNETKKTGRTKTKLFVCCFVSCFYRVLVYFLKKNIIGFTVVLEWFQRMPPVGFRLLQHLAVDLLFRKEKPKLSQKDLKRSKSIGLLSLGVPIEVGTPPKVGIQQIRFLIILFFCFNIYFVFFLRGDKP